MNARNLLSLAIFCLVICTASRRTSAEQAGSRQWEPAIQAFEAADRANPPPQGAILFVGSSTIGMWKTLAEDFPEYKVLNRGFGGSQIADCTEYADRIVIAHKPRLIVLRAGGNDIAAGKTPEQVRDDFQAFVAKVRAKLPKVRIAYMTINATPSRWTNAEREKKPTGSSRSASPRARTSMTSTPSTRRWTPTAGRGRNCSSRTGCTSTPKGTRSWPPRSGPT